MAVGVARPRAHGHAMTSTATKAVSEKVSASPTSQMPEPTKYQNRNVAALTESTAGTKYPATVSANLSIGALVLCASSTSLTIWARVVFLPTLVALTVSRPDMLTVPPVTLAPWTFSWGIDSPVTNDSSTVETPLTTSPSTGSLSPGRTVTTSPSTSSSTLTVISVPSTTLVAVGGWRSMSLRMASDVVPLDLSSRNLPARTSVIMTADVSKYTSYEPM